MVDQWVDVHAHFSPPFTDEQNAARLRALHAGGWVLSEAPRWSVATTLAYMDRAGIAMQLLSNIPKTLDALRASNDYGRTIVAEHPTRFGLLAALPTDDPDAALAEVARMADDDRVDGFAVTCRYNDVYLSDARLDPLWAELDRRGAAVFCHPDAYAEPSFGRPSPIVEVAFETARTFVDMLYAGVFRRFPNIRFVVAHCGAALPALSGRLVLLGTEPWVPNPNALTRDEMRASLRGLYLDTAMTGSAHTLSPALAMTSADHLVYGSDCGVPCTSDRTMRENIDALLRYEGLSAAEIQAIGRNALRVFPSAAVRLGALAAT